MIRAANETSLRDLLALTLKPATKSIKRWIALRIVNKRLRDEWKNREYFAEMNRSSLAALRDSDRRLINLNSHKRDLERQ